MGKRIFKIGSVDPEITPTTSQTHKLYLFIKLVVAVASNIF